jgi:lipid A 3-O-deacylase
MLGEVDLGWLWQRGAYGAQIGIVRRGNEIRDLSNGLGTQNFARLQFSYAP